MLKFISKSVKYLLNADGHIQAPKLCWRTSMVGSVFNDTARMISNLIKPNKVGKELNRVLQDPKSPEDIKRVCELFEKETGIKFLITHPKESRCFASTANAILWDIKKGYFPKNVKYFITGHGGGTVLNNNWHVEYNNKVSIFDFIEQNVPKGEMVIVNCCEHTPPNLKSLIPKEKPAIGNPCIENMGSSYHNPAKVVISGRREIIGGYGNGFLTLYK